MSRVCVWCNDDQALPGGRLCACCRNTAAGLGRLTEAEVNALPYGVMSVDIQGNIIAVNRPEQEFARIAMDRLLGKNFFTEIAPCTQVRGFRSRFEAFVNSGRAVHGFRFAYRFPDGPVAVALEFVRASQEIIIIARRIPATT